MDNEIFHTARIFFWSQKATIIPDYKAHLIISRTQYIFKGKIISSIHKLHLTISRMFHIETWDIYFCLSARAPLAEKYINKPHRCISHRVESVRK